MQTCGERPGKSDRGQVAARSTLEPQLKDEAPTARIAAAQAMLALEATPAEPVKALVAALQHRQAAVRKLAAAACAELGPRAIAAKSALKIALGDVDVE